MESSLESKALTSMAAEAQRRVGHLLHQSEEIFSPHTLRFNEKVWGLHPSPCHPTIVGKKDKASDEDQKNGSALSNQWEADSVPLHKIY